MTTVLRALTVLATAGMIGVGLLMLGPARPASSETAQEIDLTGLWGTKLGEVLIEKKAGGLEGTLVKPTDLCPLLKDKPVLLNGVLDMDNLTAEVMLCSAHPTCSEPVKVWANLTFFDAPSSPDRQATLTGMAVVPKEKKQCPLKGFSESAGQANPHGLLLKRLATLPEYRSMQGGAALAGPPAEPGTYDPRAAAKPTNEYQRLMREGMQYMGIGKAEEARKRFEEALKITPNDPNALVGIGATYMQRQDYAMAEEYYKKALAADPNYGQAYYNLACVYALKGDKSKAVSYLKIAYFNNFVVRDYMEKDPDLSSIRDMPEYKAILRDEVF